jgi:tRNA (adenine37-N6)-methyltransferase
VRDNVTMNIPEKVSIAPIGVIHSEFKSKVGVPIQTASAPQLVAQLEVYPAYAAGLRDLEGFEYLILVTHLHLATEEALEVVPFLDTISRGVFATRAPNRPNRIGLSIVRLVSIDDTTLHFEGNDMVDGTPVLDIKPYVPAFDVRQTERIGWFASRIDQLPGKRSDDRMR